MQVIEIQTLIDITNTKVNRPRTGLELQHDQFKNFSTLKQCIELRSNITYETSPIVELKELKDQGFGTNFKGKHQVWTFRFSPERSGVYEENFNEIGALLGDVQGVPVIQKLTETINMDKAIFELKDPKTKNTIIKAISGTI